MNVFIIAAVTADGFIARHKDQSSIEWTSKHDKKRFIALTKEAGVIVVGSRTFKTFPKLLKDRLNIVYTRTPERYAGIEGVEATGAEPANLIAGLTERGYKAVAICGGSEIYTKFMKAGVVSKLFLTIEPVVFGAGIPLFNEAVPSRLLLKNSETLEGGTLFLEYDVVKEA
jgi:dihydrofolate reductase